MTEPLLDATELEELDDELHSAAYEEPERLTTGEFYPLGDPDGHRGVHVKLTEQGDSWADLTVAAIGCNSVVSFNLHVSHHDTEGEVFERLAQLLDIAEALREYAGALKESYRLILEAREAREEG